MCIAHEALVETDRMISEHSSYSGRAQLGALLDLRDRLELECLLHSAEGLQPRHRSVKLARAHAVCAA